MCVYYFSCSLWFDSLVFVLVRMLRITYNDDGDSKDWSGRGGSDSIDSMVPKFIFSKQSEMQPNVCMCVDDYMRQAIRKSQDKASRRRVGKDGQISFLRMQLFLCTAFEWLTWPAHTDNDQRNIWQELHLRFGRSRRSNALKYTHSHNPAWLQTHENAFALFLIHLHTSAYT